MLHKYVVVKKEVECLQSSDSVKTHSRNRHEINILKEIKNGIAIFLPKYYIPTNKLVAFDNDCILMDYIPFKNLNQFLKIHSPSLSLLSKLYLIFSIVQSLRYLRDYKIVHLDLKPNNIMIFCNMLVKLIDFGESYHPDICLESTLYLIQLISQDLLSLIVVQKCSATKQIFSQAKVIFFQWESYSTKHYMDVFLLI